MEDLLIKVNQNTIGPLSLKKVEKLVNQGVVTSRNLVWDANSENWIPAQAIRGLEHLFGLAPLPVAAPTTDISPEHIASLPAESHLSKQGFINKPKIYAVASGKGGVGKTVLTASLGVGLATMGSEVILVDADFGGANLHTCMGILKPDYSFDDFYSNRQPLSDFLLDTPVRNLRMISGSCGSMGLANLKYQQKQRLMRALKTLAADHVIIDLGAGSDFNVIDLFLLADEPMLVVSNEPTSMQEAFGFVKVCAWRGLKRAVQKFPEALTIVSGAEIHRPGRLQLTVADITAIIRSVSPEAHEQVASFLKSFRPRIIINKVQSEADLEEGAAIVIAAAELLAIDVDYLGYISYDPRVSDAVKNFKPFLLYDSRSRAAQDLAALIRVKLLGKKGFKEMLEKRIWQKQISNFAHAYPQADPLKDSIICADTCFYWESCEFKDPHRPCRVRHLESTFRD
jgi:flagellar biosynthesis protein FlhG